MNYTNPYMNAYQPMQYNNQFYQNQQMQQPRAIQPEQFQTQQVYNPVMSLQGKTVDSVEVVKATDIPLDGSVSYFPLVDGSAIVTKKLQQDGTSKIVIYKPVDENEEEPIKVYITPEELDERIKDMDFTDELKGIKRQLKDMQDDMEDMRKDLKKRKD